MTMLERGAAAARKMQSRGAAVQPRAVLAALLVAALALLAVFYAVTALLAMRAAYSPVPFWDMWHGYIGFFLSWQDGNASTWWHAHNEHRIVLARLLFWLDLQFFHGNTVLLLAANVVMQMAVALLLLSIVLRLSHPYRLELGWPVGLAIACLLFSLVQVENLTWGFQVAFFLALLLPLLAFWLLYRAGEASDNGAGWFAAAASLGVLSIGTMANGVLVLPLMVVLALLLRHRVRRVAVLAVLCAAALVLYFLTEPPLYRRPDLAAIALAHPVAVAHYVLLYLGSPFFYSTDAGSASAALVAGVIFVLLSVFFLVLALRTRATNALPLALLAFVGYVIATALVTGTGRVVLGVEQALASRYTTTALMGWCVLFVVAAFFTRNDRIGRHGVVVAVVAAALLLVPRQLLIYRMPNPYPFERQLAGLALEMGVLDDAQIRRVNADASFARSMAEAARLRGLSVFGQPPLRGLRERIGGKAGALPTANCVAYIDAVAAIHGDARYRAVEGWIYGADTKRAPRAVAFVDAAGTVVGYGVGGNLRPDVAHARRVRDGATGFRGYILASTTEERIFLVGEQPACSVEARLPTAAAD